MTTTSDDGADDRDHYCRIVTPRANLYTRMCAAVSEREDNHPKGMDLAVLPLAQALGAAALTSKLWQVGREIRVEYRGGSAESRRIADLGFSAWEPHVNLKFTTVRRWGDIRVTFNRGQGSWSYLGTDAITVMRTEPTMNLGWDDPATAMHEVGHALGLIHEHANPLGNIPWDVEAVYRDYSGPPNYWDRATIAANVLAVYDGKLLTNAGFDSLSVMLYPIPARHVKDPSRAVGMNKTLSPGDIRLAKRLYPKPPTKPFDPTELLKGIIRNG